ncbi:DUF6197 family protein [Streptomyces griseus]|uniref:DUF6197 family protein n=1 Tax=Streptomyces griseus TaxID=1911 RepID=UPI0033EB769B
MDPVTELLGKAIEVLERDGWHQGAYCSKGAGRFGADFYAYGPDDGGSVCALGALNRANSGNAWAVHRDPDVSLVRTQAHQRLSDEIGGGVPDWNDNPSRTYEDVILTFKKAMAAGG